MNFNEIADKLDKLKDAHGQAVMHFNHERAALFAQAKNAINDYVTAKGAPLLLGLVGYTPAFNDGDPCVHRTHIVEDWDRHSVPDAWLDLDDNGDLREVEEFIADQDEAFGEDFIIIANDLIEYFDDYISSLTDEGTNFVYMFYFDGKGNMKEHEDYYDCGW